MAGFSGNQSFVKLRFRGDSRKGGLLVFERLGMTAQLRHHLGRPDFAYILSPTRNACSQPSFSLLSCRWRGLRAAAQCDADDALSESPCARGSLRVRMLWHATAVHVFCTIKNCRKGSE